MDRARVAVQLSQSILDNHMEVCHPYTVDSYSSGEYIGLPANEIWRLCLSGLGEWHGVAVSMISVACIPLVMLWKVVMMGRWRVISKDDRWDELTKPTPEWGSAEREYLKNEGNKEDIGEIILL